MKSWSSLIGVVMLMMSYGCARETPLGPAQVNDAVSSTPASASTTPSSGLAATATTYESPVVTLQADLTASPATVSVSAGHTVLMVNQSSRYVLVRSYNCSQFSSMGLQPGVSRHTMPFNTVGKTCDYFVYDYPRKIFQGQVTVN